jgi:hypothetical protein
MIDFDKSGGPVPAISRDADNGTVGGRQLANSRATKLDARVPS